ncbi:MAG: triose-phosphate isomerase [Dehalococcoidales bacterium]|nr:triose-phosphate isomerase [Dehalococcoidales bacterium]
MRLPLIAGNWKMNTNVSEAAKLVSEMRPLIETGSNVEKVVCPPFVSLAAVKEVLKGSSVKLGAQNMYFEEKGAYTGEVSPLMLSGICEYVILGHSERRQYFHETNEIINKKVRAALRVGLKPIVCVGESLVQYEAGKTESVVTDHVTGSLKDIPASDSLVIAYEPVWAIGTGKAATGPQANKVIGLVRKIVAGLYGDSFAQKLRILYGGSVTGDNIAEFIGQPEIDGGLVGGASLKVDQFASIVKQTAQMKK